LTRNTVWNLLGQGAPLLVAVLTIPLVIRGLGIERFGVLTLVWALLGYFTLFDLGLGRAITWLVARGVKADESGGVGAMLGTALGASAVLGVGGAVILLLAGELYFSATRLVLDATLRDEVNLSLAIVVALLPVVTCSSVLHGVLEGYQRFDAVNLIRIPSGVLGYLAPLTVLQFTDSLPWVVAAVTAVRVATVVAQFLVCRVITSHRPLVLAPTKPWLRRLLRFGGWLTVSNIIGPLMVYLDRFVIGAVVSLSAVAFYTTPFEVVTKLWIFPIALGTTLFPAFAVANTQERARTADLFAQGIGLMFAVMVPLAFAIIALAPEGLQLWLNHDFAAKSTTVARLLACGVLVNALAFVPMAFIHGTGRTDLTATVHLAELPFYVALLWLLTNQFGIDGAAMAWVIRAGVDCVALFWVASALLPSRALAVRGAVLTALGAALAGGAVLLDGTSHKVPAVLTAVAVFTWLTWFRLRRVAAATH
jgi:O-antigen/teichoic acid export membrane protein